MIEIREEKYYLMKRKKYKKEVKADSKRRALPIKFEEWGWRCIVWSEMFDKEEEKELMWTESDECGRWYHLNCTELNELSPLVSQKM